MPQEDYEKKLAENIYSVMKENFPTKGKIRKIVIQCDTLQDINQKKLNNYWAKLTKDDSDFGNSHIELQHSPPVGKCQLCRREFELSEATDKCPYCQCELFTIVHHPPTLLSVE